MTKVSATQKEAPERIYMDGDIEAGEGHWTRCFETPKPCSEPVLTYIRADLVDPVAIREAALDASAKYLEDQYGYKMLWHPVDRERILALIQASASQNDKKEG